MTDIRPKDLPSVSSITAGDRITLDGATTRSITVENLAGSGGLRSNSGAIGNVTGAGGAVTQITSKSTGVTLSKACGAITMVGTGDIGADTTVSFVLTNTLIAATDVLILNHISGGAPGSIYLNAQCAAGSATINVRNVTPSNMVTPAPVIQFVLVKGVNA